ncbi:MAG: hypothetical protein ACLPJY_05605, partial [Rhodomicrobium sp.]
TIFDVYVGGNGETALLLHEGGVELCNLTGSCRLLDKVGGILFVGVDGVISQFSKCGASPIRGGTLENVFPFVGKKLRVDPVRRMSLQDLECGPPGRPVVPAVQGITPPAPGTGGLQAPEIAGLVVAGGLVIGIPVIESQPASP